MSAQPRGLPALLDRLTRALGPQQWWPAESAFEVLVGAVLTQNTAWRNVETAIARLRARDWLSPSAIVNAPVDELRECLRPSGYYNVKTQRLRAACETWLALGGEAGIDAMPTTTARAELLAGRGAGAGRGGGRPVLRFYPPGVRGGALSPGVFLPRWGGAGGLGL